MHPDHTHSAEQAPPRRRIQAATALVVLALAILAGAAMAGFHRAQGAAPPDGMLRIPAGFIVLGAGNGHPEERPTGERLPVAAFWMDRTEVTNAQFAAFVRATGHVTDAEREGAAAVFRAPAKGQPSKRDGDWWTWMAGANWRRPQGPGGMPAVPQQPVVLVTLRDAYAYAAWLGHDLPTEAEWEYAARAGGSAERLERPQANFWQGIFPDVNTAEDGYAALAPVGSFPANGFGLRDMIGNAWELTKDRYAGPHQPHGNGEPAALRSGAPAGARVVIKGGSFLCAANYCSRYRAAARHAHEAGMPASHVGFRTVLRGRPLPPQSIQETS